jgi:hypothetical protein
MFQLTWEEVSELNSLRSQVVTLKRGSHLKYRPYAFTGHGLWPPQFSTVLALSP